MKPPIAKKERREERYHGIVKEDHFAWLRDDNWQDVMRDPMALSQDIRDHLEAENAYTNHILDPLKPLQEKLFAEMKGRIEDREASVPVNKGDFSWNIRYRAGDEHQLICRGPRNCARDATDIVLDCNAEADGQDYFKLLGHEETPDNSRLAWAADFNGGEYATIRIRDIASQSDLSDILTSASSSMAWSVCGQYLFYILLDDNHRPHRVMRHILGTRQDQDICIYEEADAGYFLSLYATASGRFIIISAHDHETSENWLIDAQTPTNAPICVTPRQIGMQYTVDDDAQRNRLIILTNWQEKGRADDFQIMVTPIDNTQVVHWKPLIPHQAGKLILDFNIYKDHIAWIARENALPHIQVMHLSDQSRRDITFDEPAYDITLHSTSEYDSVDLRFTYTSMTTPRKVFNFDMTSGERQLLSEQNVPSGHNAQDYITKRLWVTGHDGTKIPVSLVAHKDTPIDGSAPLLLYGYGSYGITIPASFSVARLSLVDRGFIYAIAHIRGGKALGYKWFEDGRGQHKQNTFDDFISAAKGLVAANYTHAGNISIHGGSAGGLLVGACINMEPELFCSAVAEVPFVDNLTTMLDATLPLTPPEWPEWGNPILNEADYKCIAAYAPYENIRATQYPHILATAGLTDPRVTYWEPAKWIARLRDTRTDQNLCLLKTEMHAGHGGQAGRFNQLTETALVYSFILMCHQIDH